MALRALLELREPPDEVRVVAARIALEELRTPPTDAPPLMLAVGELEPPMELPPPALDVTDPAKELGVLPPPLPLDEGLLLDPPPDEEPPPPPLLDPPPPPPPRLRPMNPPPPPPEKLRLPRNCGPRIVTNFSGPVVPVSRRVCVSFPLPTGAVRIDADKARLAATASSAKFF